MKAAKIIVSIILVLALSAGSFSIGLLSGWFLPKPAAMLPAASETVTVSPTQPKVTPSGPTDTKTLFEPFWEAWDIVHLNYVDQPIDDALLMQGAIRGMMQGLGDQHSSYMTPEEYQNATEDLQGKEYSGIGAWVDTSKDYLTIIDTMPESPAEKAGLKTGDQIVSIDGEDQTGIQGDVVLKKVLGPDGTRVVLTIARASLQKPFDVEIIRAKITVPSAKAKMLDGNIGYVKIYQFGTNTTRELRDGLSMILKNKPVGLIVDLRGNGGGYLDTSVEVISEFIAPNQIAVIEEYGDKTHDELKTKRGGLALDIPLAVLVNGGSASAAEITAGAIQDYGRGALVGTVTYGKGSVQTWHPLNNNQGAVRVTIARWLTPKGNLIHEIGITPDYVVELTEKDIAEGKDPQLDKAIELLTK